MDQIVGALTLMFVDGSKPDVVRTNLQQQNISEGLLWKSTSGLLPYKICLQGNNMPKVNLEIRLAYLSIKTCTFPSPWNIHTRKSRCDNFSLLMRELGISTRLPFTGLQIMVVMVLWDSHIRVLEGEGCQIRLVAKSEYNLLWNINCPAFGYCIVPMVRLPMRK